MARQQEYIVRLPSGEGYKVTGPEGLSDDEVIAEIRKTDPNFDRPERAAGARLPESVRAGMTALQGAFMGSADELAGAAATAAQAGSYAGAGYARQPTPTIRPEQAYTPAREAFRGGVESYRQEQPSTALGLEIAGAVGGLPASMVFGVPRFGMTGLRKGYEFLKPIVGTSAVTAVGETEAEAPEDFATDVARRTAEGTLYGTAFGLGGKGLATGISQIAQRTPGLREPTAILPARERLAQILQRDMEAKILMGDADPVTIAETRLRKLGPDAPIAATGRAATGELGLLKNMPGSAETLAARESRRITKQRGPSLITAAEEALDARGVPFRATVQEFANQAKEKAAPFYQQLRTTDFDVDNELSDIISRAKKAYGEAEELAAVSGMPQRLDLGKVQPGDRVPFEVLDNLKRTLYDIEEAAKGEFGKPTNKSRAYTNLRRDLIRKLDELSPKDKSGQSIYKQARTTFEGEAQLETAMRRGREVLSEDVEELQEIINDLEPSQLEAFQLGAAQALRDISGTPAGQTRLLNMYKDPTMQSRLRAVFGKDFRKFQRAVLQQEELKRVERAGEGSQSFKLFAGAEDQAAAMDAIDLAAAAGSGSPTTMFPAVARKYAQLKMPEATRNQLARLLLLRGEPAKDELTDLRKYIERRRLQQQLAGQLAGRSGAITAAE